MRIFRTEEAARLAGYVFIGASRVVKRREEKIGYMDGVILTDRERALLEALEKVSEIAWASTDKDVDDISVLKKADDLIKSLNVEG